MSRAGRRYRLLLPLIVPPLLSFAPKAPQAGDGAGGSLELDSLRPYFSTDPSAKEAVQKLRAGDPQPALAFFPNYLAKKPAAKDALQGRFFLALAQKRSLPSPAGEDEMREPMPLAIESASAFARLATDYPILSPYHRLYSARTYLQAGRPKEALDQALQIAADSPLACEALFLRAESQRRLAKIPGAIADYQAYLQGGRCRARADVSLRLAELLEKNGDPKGALERWRALYLGFPTEKEGILADRQLDLSGKDGRQFTPRELLGRAQILFDNMRNQESEIAYRQILSDKGPTGQGPDAEVRCIASFHLAQSVFKQRQRPRAAPLFDEAAKVCADPGAQNPDLHMKALYQGARCHGSKGELQIAADLFAQAEAAHKDHSYADDARLRQAEMYADLLEKLRKQGAKATCGEASCPDYEAKLTQLLSEMPELYPTGDQRAEALFRLAFRALSRKDFDKAKAHLEETLRRIPRETGWDQEGRTLYWLGRIADMQGRQADALDLYKRAAKEYPLSYYCLLSLNRIRERAEGEFARFLFEVSAAKDAADQKEEGSPFRFAPRPLFAQPGFLRAVELMKLGLGQEAQKELAALGIRLPEGKGQKVTSSDQEELLLLSAVLYERAGDFHHSHWLPRHSLTSYQRYFPQGPWRKIWHLSYPRGYEDLLTDSAKKNGQPEALQFAIVREESAFDPLTESFANAIGLTQMIPPTAKRFSPGLPTTREALRDPVINVAIGGRFLGFLWSTMQGNPALTIAGYNAGEGAVFRWLSQRGDLDLDAFVETIPFDETRGYTKRVLSSYLSYSWLAVLPTSGPTNSAMPDLSKRLAQAIPTVSNRLPTLPQVRKQPSPEPDAHRK